MHDGNGNYFEYHLEKHVEGSEIDTERWHPGGKLKTNMKASGVEETHKFYLYVDHLHIKTLNGGHGNTFTDVVNITAEIQNLT